MAGRARSTGGTLISRVLLLDTETTGTDDASTCIEVAAAVYSVPCAAVQRSFSSLIRATENPARAVNRIPDALLADAPEADRVWRTIASMARDTQALVAHNASFDARFVTMSLPWVCSMEDLEWPRGQAMLARGLRPKATFVVAARGFDAARNELAKANGFRWRWEGDDKVEIAEVLATLGLKGQPAANRVAAALQDLGWKHERRQIEGERCWRYHAPTGKGLDS